MVLGCAPMILTFFLCLWLFQHNITDSQRTFSKVFDFQPHLPFSHCPLLSKFDDPVPLWTSSLSILHQYQNLYNCFAIFGDVALQDIP